MATEGSLAKGNYFGTKYVKSRLASNSAINAGATAFVDLDVSDLDGLSVLVSMTAAGTTDLVLSVFAFSIGGTPHQQPLSPSPAPQAQTLVGGSALAAVQYDLKGIDTVRISVKNANAGAKSIDYIDVFGAVTGVDF